MRALIAIVLLVVPALALAQPPAPRHRPPSRITQLETIHIEGRRQVPLSILVPRSRDRYEPPALVRRDMPHEIVRSVRRGAF